MRRTLSHSVIFVRNGNARLHAPVEELWREAVATDEDVTDWRQVFRVRSVVGT